MKIKPRNITTFKSEEFTDLSAQFLKELIQELLDEKEIIHIALSGGSSPLPVYSKLSTFDIDWSRISFFIVDERCVSVHSDDNNYRNIKSCFLDKIPSASFPVMQEGLNFSEAANQYQELIKKELTIVDGFPQFDLILLGMGLDGHTASLFPETEALKNTQDLMVLNHVPQLETYRITMTYPLILNAKRIVLIAKGEAKKKVLDNIIENKHPISKIIPQIYHTLV